VATTTAKRSHKKKPDPVPETPPTAEAEYDEAEADVVDGDATAMKDITYGDDEVLVASVPEHVFDAWTEGDAARALTHINLVRAIDAELDGHAEDDDDVRAKAIEVLGTLGVSEDMIVPMTGAERDAMNKVELVEEANGQVAIAAGRDDITPGLTNDPGGPIPTKSTLKVKAGAGTMVRDFKENERVLLVIDGRVDSVKFKGGERIQEVEILELVEYDGGRWNGPVGMMAATDDPPAPPDDAPEAEDSDFARGEADGQPSDIDALTARWEAIQRALDEGGLTEQATEDLSEESDRLETQLKKLGADPTTDEAFALRGNAQPAKGADDLEWEDA
jgi:hypothetical protein